MANTMDTLCMKSISSLLISVLFSSVSLADTDVYVTRDANGNPVFSDQPSGNSEKIVIDELQTVEESRPVTRLPENTDSRLKEVAKYKSIQVTSPANDEAIRENSGTVAISVALDPGLRGNDVIVVSMSGEEVARGAANSIVLNNVDRGSHTLIAEVLSPDGTTLIRSEPVTFHLLRVSVSPPPANPPP